MSELVVKDKEIVTPGQILAVGMDFLPSRGTYRENENIRAGMLGLVSIEGKVLKIIPLSGRYLPKRGDTIIGKVIDITLNGWRCDIDSAYTAMLTLKDATSDFIQKGADLSHIYNLGDYIVAKIVQVTSQKLVDLSTKGPGLRKLKGGRIIKVNTHKVPRVIGKQGSMVSMIKKYTGTNIIVGQNGLIWINSDDPAKEAIAEQAIKIIERDSHISGLTDKIKEFLEKECGKIAEGEQNGND